jgi:hypothetical protein
MSHSRRFDLLSLVAFLLISSFYWLLPIGGQVAYIPGELPQPNTWPQVTVANEEGGRFELLVEDPTPHVHVRLETAGAAATLVEHGAQNAAGAWQWRWQVQGNPAAALYLYHSCDAGCRPWAMVQAPAAAGSPGVSVAPPGDDSGRPTKLGVVFAHPGREWHNRQGWTVEVTYARLAEEEFWGIHDLVQRVQHAHAKGLNVLVRVEYDQGQNLPPAGDHAALDDYLRYLRRLARDARLAGVYGLIIGSNFNTAAANSQSPDNPVTAAWYARIFNGYGVNVSNRNNAVETIRSENRQVRVLAGPVSPWNGDQSGEIGYAVDVPWLNYMNTAVAYLDAGARAKAAQGISQAGPDGFAVQAFGRVDHPGLTAAQRAEEPLLDLYREEWGPAQAGFRVYRDWLAIINGYPYTAGKPVYISAANTFDPQRGRSPAENYPPGWLTNALAAVNEEPQIHALAWFMDSFPHDDQWALFSLTGPRALLIEGAREFDGLLQAR